MKQQTAMQLMLWYLENEGLENSGAYYKAKHLLELEKEQMRLADKNGNDRAQYFRDLEYGGAEYWDKQPEPFEQYYNETYGGNR